MTDTTQQVTEQEEGPWQWAGDQEGYDDWLNSLLQGAPDSSWDYDSAAESILLEYVQHLERLVIAAYGREGLERHYEDTVKTDDLRLREWLTKHMPHVDHQEGVATPIIALLDICHTAVSTTVPVLQSIAGIMLPKLRHAGLLRRCSCDADKSTPGRHHMDKCPMRTGWL